MIMGQVEINMKHLLAYHLQSNFSNASSKTMAHVKFYALYWYSPWCMTAMAESPYRFTQKYGSQMPGMFMRKDPRSLISLGPTKMVEQVNSSFQSMSFLPSSMSIPRMSNSARFHSWLGKTYKVCFLICQDFLRTVRLEPDYPLTCPWFSLFIC